MKKFAFFFAACLLPLLGHTAEREYAPFAYSYVDGTEYACQLPLPGLYAGPRWRPEQALPIGLPRLYQIARQELFNFTKSFEGWRQGNISITRHSGTEPDLWYVSVTFWHDVPPQPGFTRSNQFTVLIDLAGHPAVIRLNQTR